MSSDERSPSPPPQPSPSEQLAQSTSTLLIALPAYLAPNTRLVTSDDVQQHPGSGEDALVKAGRHKHGPAARAAGFVARLGPLARVSLDEDEVSDSEPVVAALNALALVFSITTRQDDALEQLEKIAYQASRVQGLVQADEDVRDASRTLLAAVLTFLRGALRKPGVNARRVPMGAAQMYAAGKQRLNGAIGAYDAALSGSGSGDDDDE